MKTKKISFVSIVIFVAAILVACGPSKQSDLSAVSSEIKIFLQNHSEYGSIKSIEDMPDWAFGKRKKIRTSSGSYLFYLREGEVVGVDKYLPSGGREKIFKKD